MRKYFYVLAACLAFAACNKEQSVIEEASFQKGQVVTLTVSAPTQTKVNSTLESSGGVSFKWEDGDAIKVTVGASSATFTVSKLIEGGASAEFTGTMPASGNTFNAQYPLDDPDITVQAYSSNQAIPYKEMKFAANNCTVGEPFELVAVNAALRLNLWAEDKTISKIIIFNTAEPSLPNYTLNINPAVTLPTSEENAMPFLVVVPAGDYTFKAQIYNDYSVPAILCELEAKTTNKFVENYVLNMPPKKIEVPTYPDTDDEGTPIVINGKTLIWAPVNCGATAQNKYGLLYQWGRKYGQPYSAGNLTPTEMTKEDDTEANKDKFGVGINHSIESEDPLELRAPYYSWFYGKDYSLWNAGTGNVKGSSDPCPGKWRIPSNEEFIALIGKHLKGKLQTCSRGYYKDIVGKYFDGTTNPEPTSGVFFPAEGDRYWLTGEVEYLNTRGYYWSKTPTTLYENAAEMMAFVREEEAEAETGNTTLFHEDFAAHALSVRCVLEVEYTYVIEP